MRPTGQAWNRCQKWSTGQAWYHLISRSNILELKVSHRDKPGASTQVQSQQLIYQLGKCYDLCATLGNRRDQPTTFSVGLNLKPILLSRSLAIGVVNEVLTLVDSTRGQVVI